MPIIQSDDNLTNINDDHSKAFRPVTDLSARVVNLARRIDRLPSGVYQITIEKPEIRAADWDIIITRVEHIQALKLPKMLANE